MSRETTNDLYFPAVAYYDGQGFMVPTARNIDSALALDGSKVCVQEGTTTQLNRRGLLPGQQYEVSELIRAQRTRS